MAETQVSSGNVVTNYQGKRMKKHPAQKNTAPNAPMARAGVILAAATRRANPVAKIAKPKRIKLKK